MESLKAVDYDLELVGFSSEELDAILVDPDDVDALRDAMRRVADDEALREELARRGAEVVTGFSWDETARATVAAYEELGATR